MVSHGRNMADAIRQIGVSEGFIAGQEYGGLKTKQIKQPASQGGLRSDAR
jgi:hypothetical protein